MAPAPFSKVGLDVWTPDSDGSETDEPGTPESMLEDSDTGSPESAFSPYNGPATPVTDVTIPSHSDSESSDDASDDEEVSNSFPEGVTPPAVFCT